MTGPTSPMPELQIDGERMARGIAQRAALALAEAWIDAARQDAAVQALLEQQNVAARAADQEAATAKRAGS